MAVLSTPIGKPGMVHRGEYNPSTLYTVNDIVTYGGSSFVCISDVTGINPNNATYWRLLALRGAEGFLQLISVPYAASLTITANIMTEIAVLTGAITLTLGPPLSGYDNEWGFTLTQGATAYNVVLPVIKWAGAMPTFAANSTTQVRLFYVGSQLTGVWFSA